MENFRISDIINATSGSLEKGDPNAIVNSISSDSRLLKNGDLFVALIGERFDGHNFAVNAIKQEIILEMISF